mgnify:CR=1 FL=1
MDVFERRAIIEERVTDHGEVQFADLAREFGVSEMTIRRDIEVLQSAGIVRRVSGGAIAVPGTAFEPSYGSRAGHAVEGFEDRMLRSDGGYATVAAAGSRLKPPDL